jgi:hypothetical protein
MYQVFESYTDSSFDVNDVCYGNGIYVAVGGEATSSPRIFTSTNTIDWTERTSGITNTTCWLKQIVYGNGIFVAVGISSDQMRRYAITSVDGINWTEAINDQGVAYHLNCVEYWDKTKQFWIGGYRATYISSDGVIWSDGPYVFPSHYANVSHTSICGAPIGICFIPMYYGNRWYVFSIDGITMPPTSEFIDSDSGLDPYKSVWDGTEIWTTLYETGCLDSYNPVTRVLTHRDISGRLVYGIAYDGKSILLVGTYYDTLNTGIYEWNGSGYNRIVNTKLKSLRGICYNTVDNVFCAVGNGIAYLIHKIYPYHKAFYNEGDEIVYAPGSTNENNGEIGTALWDMKKDNSGNVLITQTHSPGCGYWFKDDDPVVGDRGKGDKSSNVNTKWLEYKSQYPWECV